MRFYNSYRGWKWDRKPVWAGELLLQAQNNKMALEQQENISQTGYSYKHGATNGPWAADALSLCMVPDKDIGSKRATAKTGTLQKQGKDPLRSVKIDEEVCFLWPVWVVYFHGKFLLAEIQILQLLPLKQLQREFGRRGEGRHYTSLKTQHRATNYMESYITDVIWPP